MLNNPLRYSDPTGNFSEDQIKKYLGFAEDDPWDDVLKLFEKGGKYAGRWGWLETLRQAELGDEIGWYGDYDWFYETPYDSELYRGTLTEIDGQLYLEGASGLLPIFDAAMQGENIFVDRGVGRVLYFNAQTKYYRPQFKEWSDIDKVDLGVDVFGLVGDVAFLVPGPGTAVWAISEIPEFLTLGKSWDALEMGDPSGVLIDTGVTLAQVWRLLPEGGWVGNLFGLGVNGLEITP